MNIHIDKEVFTQLEKATFATFEVGSPLYNLQTEESDKDLLSIYIEDDLTSKSFLWEHHQLQYKEEKVDRNFTTLQGFIRNILTGDATINFELLFTEEMKNSSLDFLYKKRFQFINYNIIKSYLGLAKRDFKSAFKGLHKTNNKDALKSLSHAVRGVMFADQLIFDPENFNMKNEDDSYVKYYNNRDLLFHIKTGEFSKEEIEFIMKIYIDKMEDLRSTLNHKLIKGDIERIGSFSFLKDIDTLVIVISKIQGNKENISRDMFYETLSKGIQY